MSLADVSDRGSHPRHGLGSRLSDLVNPILVREVQQAVKGRVFPWAILIALAVSVVIASVVSAEERGVVNGRGVFSAGLATLAPLLLFVVPMQAYNSMRTELRGGIVEQLLMTRLGPGRVLIGKLQAAMVQFLLYVSLLAPLLATSYLLRGVDLPTIAVSLFFAFVACLTATAIAISSAAQAIVPALQAIANLGMAFGLGVATLGAVVAIAGGDYTQLIGALIRSGQLTVTLTAVTLAATVSVTLSWLTARTYLLHAFEDKSSGFRVFLWTLPVLVYGWMCAFVEQVYWIDVFPFLTVGMLLAGIGFGVFMVTEQRPLSPRVRFHVPKGGLTSALAAPLLPGRDRGMLCFTAFALCLLAVGWSFWPQGGLDQRGPDLVARVGLVIFAYGLFYLNAGRWLRGLLPETVPGSQAGRVVMPVLLFACIVVPLLVDGLRGGYVGEWHWGHVLNPFWTTVHAVSDRWVDAQPVVLGALVVLSLAQLPIWIRGVGEVTRASAALRRR